MLKYSKITVCSWLFLDCALMRPFWNVIKTECALFATYLIWNGPFWIVLLCALFGMWDQNGMCLFCNVLDLEFALLECALNGLCPFLNFAISLFGTCSKCDLDRMCFFGKCPFWNVVKTECALLEYRISSYSCHGNYSLLKL